MDIPLIAQRSFHCTLLLQDQLTELEQAEREEYLAQYAQRRYKEQRLELLLQAKGIGAPMPVIALRRSSPMLPPPLWALFHSKDSR